MSVVIDHATLPLIKFLACAHMKPSNVENSRVLSREKLLEEMIQDAVDADLASVPGFVKRV